jgi:hypothetical protein
MAGRRRRARATEHLLVDHELAVVLADGAGGRRESGVRHVGARRPLPNLAVPARRVVLWRGRDGFPLGFQREACAGPARVRVGFVPTHMRDRGARIERLQPLQPEHERDAVDVVPILRTGPVVGLHGVPAVRHPQLGPGIPSVIDEREPLLVRHQVACHLERTEKNFVARPLVVERETAPAMADFHDTAVVGRPSAPPRSTGTAPWQRAVGREQRVARERVLDVHHDELLVLLFVVKPELDELAELGGNTAGQHVDHRSIDMVAVVGDFGDAGPSDVAAVRPRVSRAHRLVVGVEQVAVCRVAERVGGRERCQHKRLEEPGGVRTVPLGRARVRHRLDGLVLRAQTRRKPLGRRPDRAVIGGAHRTASDTA